MVREKRLKRRSRWRPCSKVWIHNVPYICSILECDIGLCGQVSSWLNGTASIFVSRGHVLIRGCCGAINVQLLSILVASSVLVSFTLNFLFLSKPATYSPKYWHSFSFLSESRPISTLRSLSSLVGSVLGTCISCNQVPCPITRSRLLLGISSLRLGTLHHPGFLSCDPRSPMEGIAEMELDPWIDFSLNFYSPTSSRLSSIRLRNLRAFLTSYSGLRKQYPTPLWTKIRFWPDAPAILRTTTKTSA